MVGRKRVGDLELAASPTFLSCQMTLDGEKPWALGHGQPCSRAASQIGGLPLRLYATVHAGPIDHPIGSRAYCLPPNSAKPA